MVDENDCSSRFNCVWCDAAPFKSRMNTPTEIVCPCGRQFDCPIPCSSQSKYGPCADIDLARFYGWYRPARSKNTKGCKWSCPVCVQDIDDRLWPTKWQDIQTSRVNAAEKHMCKECASAYPFTPSWIVPLATATGTTPVARQPQVNPWITHVGPPPEAPPAANAKVAIPLPDVAEPLLQPGAASWSLEPSPHHPPGLDDQPNGVAVAPPLAPPPPLPAPPPPHLPAPHQAAMQQEEQQDGAGGSGITQSGGSMCCRSA